MTERLTDHPWSELGFTEIAELEETIAGTEVEKIVFGVCVPPEKDVGQKLLMSLIAAPFHGYFPTGITWWITSHLPDLSTAYSRIERISPVTYLDIDLTTTEGQSMIEGYADMGATTMESIGTVHGKLNHLYARSVVGAVASKRGISFPGAVVNVRNPR